MRFFTVHFDNLSPKQSNLRSRAALESCSCGLDSEGMSCNVERRDGDLFEEQVHLKRLVPI